MKVIYKILAYAFGLIAFLTVLTMSYSIIDFVIENENIYVRVVLSSFIAISIPILVSGSLFLPASKYVVEILNSGVVYYSLILWLFVLFANFIDLVFYPDSESFFTEKSLYIVAVFGFLLILMKKSEK